MKGTNLEGKNQNYKPQSHPCRPRFQGEGSHSCHHVQLQRDRTECGGAYPAYTFRRMKPFNQETTYANDNSQLRFVWLTRDVEQGERGFDSREFPFHDNGELTLKIIPLRQSHKYNI